MIRQSHTAVSVGLQRSLRQFDGECTVNPQRLQYDSSETALLFAKFLTRLKNFAGWRLHSVCAETHCECMANALRLRGDFEN